MILTASMYNQLSYFQSVAESFGLSGAEILIERVKTTGEHVSFKANDAGWYDRKAPADVNALFDWEKTHYPSEFETLHTITGCKHPHIKPFRDQSGPELTSSFFLKL